ncbi:glycosyltransferase family 9 protein [Fusobacterium sp. PH5-44]|uniref:glycosyltransferase family 9 protein n=1 Tax=unclassified Fusobacterium TaxID=2648384 RepID=UPI003D21CE30
MLRKINRRIKGNLRKIRISIARLRWDHSNKHHIKEKETFLNICEIKSILFLRADGKIGDMVISTFIFREIKKKYPNIKIGVVTKGGAKDIISFNPYVDKIYDYGNKMSSVKKLAKKISEEKYDLLVEFYEEIKPMEIMFISKSNAKYNMGLNKSDWKLFNVSLNENSDFKWDDHVSKRYIACLEKIGFDINNIDDSYEIFFDEQRKKEIEKIKLEYSDKNIILLNPFGASKHRNFSDEIIKKILNELKNQKVILLYHGDKYDKIIGIASEYNNVIIPNGIKSILDSAMYISIAGIVISPDTSIVHIADSFNKKIIGVYEYDGGILGSGEKVWGPRGKSNHKLVFTPKRKSTYDDFDVNNFDMREMNNAVKKFLLEGEKANVL